MNLDMVMGRKIHELFTDLEARYEMVIYSKIEDSYFLKLPEQEILEDTWPRGYIPRHRV